MGGVIVLSSWAKHFSLAVPDSSTAHGVQNNSCDGLSSVTRERYFPKIFVGVCHRLLSKPLR